eukprot:Lithocolla_globosa_v1_NODE_2750_length_1885_cov_2.946448.p2 type:complete len:124 gc:universal NODE_2750_length_1885_cov_2.946448:467-838(+)
MSKKKSDYFLNICSHYRACVDIVVAGGNLLGTWLDSEEAWCVTQSFLTTTASMCSFFWTFFIPLYLYLSLPSHNLIVAYGETKVFFFSSRGSRPTRIFGYSSGRGSTPQNVFCPPPGAKSALL